MDEGSGVFSAGKGLESKDSNGKRMQCFLSPDLAAVRSSGLLLDRWLTNTAAGILPPLGLLITADS